MKGAERRTEQHQLQSQMQTAPFVRASDRASKDVSDMSMSDFAPKRFAIKYEPIPTIGKSKRPFLDISLAYEVKCDKLICSIHLLSARVPRPIDWQAIPPQDEAQERHGRL